jgi:hypothetical protein
MHQFKRTLLCSTLAPVLLSAAANPAAADLLVDAGQRAMLIVNITVEGKVEQPKGYRDEVVKWSTQRAFKASVEMVADKAQTMSYSDIAGGQGGAGQAVLADIQKQAEACGDDQACQMQVAMQMMNSPALQQSVNAPPRYQAWRAVEGGSRVDVSGSYEETLHTVFYTAARETTDCTLTAPKVSPELTSNGATSGENWSKQSRETLENSARSFIVEVDGSGKTGVLNINSVLGVGFGDIKCVQNIGSGPESSHHSTNPTLLPVGEASMPIQVPGLAAGNAVIASGSGSLERSQKVNNLGAGFAGDVVAPLKVAVRWELKKM